MAKFSKSSAAEVPFMPKRKRQNDRRLDPVWSCGCLNPRVESNDGTVLPTFNQVCSPEIRSAIMQPNAMPKLKLPRLTKWNTVFPTFNPVCSPEIRSAIMQPNAMPKLKLPRLTKWSPIIILALHAAYLHICTFQ